MAGSDNWVAVVAVHAGSKRWRFCAHLVEAGGERRVVTIIGTEMEPPHDFFNDCCHPDGLPVVFEATLQPRGGDPDRVAFKGDVIELARLEGALALIGGRFEFHTSKRLDQDDREATETLETYFPAWIGLPLDELAICMGTARLDLSAPIPLTSRGECLHASIL